MERAAASARAARLISRHDDRSEAQPEDARPLGSHAASRMDGQTVTVDLFLGQSQSVLHKDAGQLAAFHASRTRQRYSRFTGVDWKKTMRIATRYGGRALSVVRQRQFVQPPRSVVLWDVSGSMRPYIPMYLAWLYQIVQQSRRLRVLPFGITIEDVTDELRRPFPQAIAQLAMHHNLFVGGTSIGGAVRSVVDGDFAALIPSGGTLVVVSDGWDNGSPNEIATALRILKRRDVRVVWVHPLLKTPGFEAKTRALLAAMPYVDAMLPGDEASLGRLGARL